ncbi:MAG: peptidoglycan bridge formation glycyltransferase FemA/FemB family protein [Acidobacteriota bacterium]
MAKWESLTDEKARLTWDQMMARFDDCSPFQSYGWGEYRRGLGWKPYRWIASDDQGEVIAMIQGYLRRHPFGLGLVWSEGGPVGDLSACDESLQAAITGATGLRRVYCRFRCDRKRNIEDALRLGPQGWSIPWSPLTSNYTMTLDLTQDEAQMLKGCERNWRRNLKRSQEAKLNIRQWLEPTVEQIAAVYQSMQQVKGLEEQHSQAEIEQLLLNASEKMVIFRCDDESGQVISLIASLLIGNRACSVLSATSAKGRELHASYGVFLAMITHCRNAGVRTYDLAGIDPVRNPGVYRFKRATGATPVELLGEWDWASRPWLRWFGNWAISQRNRIRRAETVVKPAASVDSNHAVVERSGAETIRGKLIET